MKRRMAELVATDNKWHAVLLQQLEIGNYDFTSKPLLPCDVFPIIGRQRVLRCCVDIYSATFGEFDVGWCEFEVFQRIAGLGPSIRHMSEFIYSRRQRRPVVLNRVDMSRDFEVGRVGQFD